jgi:hypothetical protein
MVGWVERRSVSFPWSDPAMFITLQSTKLVLSKETQMLAKFIHVVAVQNGNRSEPPESGVARKLVLKNIYQKRRNS